MYTILMVDDEDNIRKALINAVDWNELGFEIIGEATNGIEALEFIEHNEVDLLVSDIKMPIMGGIELAREAREIRPSMQMVFLSGYDHFEFAKQAIRYNILEYILKPITSEQIQVEFSAIRKKLDGKFSEILDIDVQIDALKELQDVKQKLFLTNLIHNQVTEEQVYNFFQDASMMVPVIVEKQYRYVVCIVKISEQENGNKGDLVYKRLENISRIISTKYISCECFLYGTSVVILGCDKEVSLNKYLSILSKDIVLSSKRIMNIDICFAQSNYYEELLLTHVAYQEANDAIICIEHTGEQFVHIKDLIANSDDVRIQELLHGLENRIISGNKNEVVDTIDVIFRELQTKQINSTEFNAYVLEILAVLFKARRMLSDEMQIKMMITKFITFHSSKKMIQNEILELSTALVDGIASQRQKSVGNLVTSAIAIIEKEYNNSEMSLGLLAEQLHCSANYLSSNIKRSLGKSFVELLVEARMEKARELLLTTNLKIREISETCGFANQHYFSYSFKKHYNISPNAIRKSHIE